MPYSRQIDQVFAGGVNYSAPSDQIPSPYSAIMQNGRVLGGLLELRRGSQMIAEGLEAHSMFRHGDYRYAGVGTKLRHGSAYGTEIDSGYDGEPLFFAAYQDRVWVMNRGKRASVSSAVVRQWGIDAPATTPIAAVGLAGILTGDYVYYVTFADSYGREGNPSEASNTVTLTDEQANLSAIAVSADPQITQRFIYRAGTGMTAALRVGTIPDNVTTTFTDNLSNADAAADNFEMPIFNDPPPAARGVAGPYFGKLLAWSTEEHPARLFWSDTAKPQAFPGADDGLEGNWLDIGGEDDELLCVTIHTNWIGIYKRHSIWRLVGDPDDNNPELVARTIGTNSPISAISGEAVDYFASLEAVSRFDGDTITPISDNVRVLVNGDAAFIATGGLIQSLDMSTVALGLAIDTLHVAGVVPGGGQYTLIYNVRTGEWGTETSTRGSCRAFYNEQEASGSLIGAFRNGGIGALETGHSDDGVAIPFRWRSRFYDQGAPDAVKRYGEVAIDFQTDFQGFPPGELTVVAIYDNDGTTAVTLGTISSATRTVARFKLGTDAQGRKARNIAIQISGDLTNHCRIYRVIVHYYAEARLARSFDSGVFPLAGGWDARMFRFKLDVEGSGNFDWDLHTDLPGNTIVSRETGSVAGDSGRRFVTVDLEAPKDGRLARLMGWSDSNFQLHRIWIEKQEIPVYIDSTRPFETELVNV